MPYPNQEKTRALIFSEKNSPDSMIREQVSDDIVHDLLSEKDWIESIILSRISLERKEGNTRSVFYDSIPPCLSNDGPYNTLIQKMKLSAIDRACLILALIPHFSPNSLNRFFVSKKGDTIIRNSRFGGYVDKLSLNYYPTIHTIIYLISGNDQELSIQLIDYFLNHFSLVNEQIIRFFKLGEMNSPLTALDKIVSLNAEYANYLLTNSHPRPDYGYDFPARLVNTSFVWNDLVLENRTVRKVHKIRTWLDHREELLALCDGKVNSSFPCLFFGPPGTGKSLTAKLLGKEHNLPVFRIDLSIVVSKYIGETEKNLSILFERSEGKNWILFFDEADSLFSKRTSVSSSNDKYANLELSYLLQRIEEYSGLVILATNLSNNIDSAMMRRFQAIVEFHKPGVEDQLRLWKLGLPKAFSYSSEIDFSTFSKYDLTGANIANIIKIAVMITVSKKKREIEYQVLYQVIRDELHKENRTI